MDREIWIVLECAVRLVVRRLPKPRRRFEYTDRLILLMWLWAAMHDRPRSWACVRVSYSSLFRPRTLPSVSQFCKRLKSERMVLARRMLHELLVAQGHQESLGFLDGKGLLVGEYSTDPDACNGIASGRYRKGYKLHARSTSSGFFVEYTVLPLNEGEPNTARELLEHLPAHSVTLADANYDSHLLYDAVHERGGQLLTRLKGRGRSLTTLRKMGPVRREAIEVWDTRPELCEQVLHKRDAIERHLAHLTNCGGGLSSLPAWVRTLSRVRLWIDAKIALYHARRLARDALAVM